MGAMVAGVRGEGGDVTTKQGKQTCNTGFPRAQVVHQPMAAGGGLVTLPVFLTLQAF